MKREYLAHSESSGGMKETVIDHLLQVADLSEKFAAPWGCSQEGRASGLFHDLGKYGELFQKVLRHEEYHIDHAAPGAFALLQQYGAKSMAAAIAVQGHHDGLVTGVPRTFVNMIDLRKHEGYNEKRYSSTDIEKLKALFITDGGEFPVISDSNYPEYCKKEQYISAMMYVRMLYSALTDADFLATEAHFNRENGEYIFRPPGVILDSGAAFQRLCKYREGIKRDSIANSAVNRMRDDLYDRCVSAGSLAQDIFTLTAPTGSGKTLAALAFALEHARNHRLDRVIIVLPYLNIIEQTAAEYEKILNPLSNRSYILQDHSLADAPDEEQSRLLAENWDSPVIITTTVKFFEGLFGNRSTVCRRLHNIARSVIVFDEAQTMPPQLVIPTLAVISELVSRYGCSAVFSTATQPAFEVLAKRVGELCGVPWYPTEIVPPDLITKTKRVEVHWPELEDRIDWPEIANQVMQHNKALVIVNLRRHAISLFNLIKESQTDGVFHLSTNMCAEHRKQVLKDVKHRLVELNRQCILISTQCIEAGVDIDFPVVFRAFAPLDSIIQSAGRCNRNGKMDKGILQVFQPPMEKREYPDNTYEQAAVQVKLMLDRRRHIPGGIDIEDQATVKEYYASFFSGTGVNNEELQQYIEALDFVQTAKTYKWIAQHGINVLVPYGPKRDIYEDLCQEARTGKINREWITRARMLAVNATINKQSKLYDQLEPVVTRHGGLKEQTGWYILLNEEAYSEDIGLINQGIEVDLIV